MFGQEKFTHLCYKVFIMVIYTEVFMVQIQSAAYTKYTIHDAHSIFVWGKWCFVTVMF